MRLASAFRLSILCGFYSNDDCFIAVVDVPILVTGFKFAVLNCNVVLCVVFCRLSDTHSTTKTNALCIFVCIVCCVYVWALVKCLDI